jgi:hypothetical protein
LLERRDVRRSRIDRSFALSCSTPIAIDIDGGSLRHQPISRCHSQVPLALVMDGDGG